MPSALSRSRSLALALLASALAALAAAGCGSQAGGAAGTGHLQIVAAENFWGSLAAQLAGSKAEVHSIIVNPDTDPHSYEPTAQDARTMAEAKLAIVNGLGYDEWSRKLLAANPLDGRVTLNVGDALGLHVGDNPHQWYSPASVRRVIAAIVAGLDRLDAADAGYFAARQRELESRGLAAYDRLRREIRARYAGVPVGYSESIFQPLGEDLGLKLLTPKSFADAIAEGIDVSAGDKQTVDSQAESKRRKVWVFNSQNVQRINAIARARRIPIATVTETLSPVSDDFEQWQAAQLQHLAQALHEATGR
jgi:zinc/manganese transport system substrate-binding protein